MVSTKKNILELQEINKELSKKNIVKRLKFNLKQISKIDKSIAPTVDLINIKNSIIDEFFINHTDVEIQILSLSCIMQIIGINPIDSNLSSDDLQLLFGSTIALSEFLFLTNSCYYESTLSFFKMLKNNSSFSIFNVPKFNDQIHKLFLAFFSHSNEIEISNESYETIKDLSIQIINEFEVIKNPVIFSMFNTSHINQTTVLCRLLSEIFASTWEKLKPCFRDYVVNSLSENKDIETYTNCFKSLSNISIVYPSSIYSIIPNILDEALNTNVDRRACAVTFLVKLIKNPYFHNQDYFKNLLSVFLGRFEDSSVNIRILCIKNSVDFLLFENCFKDIYDCVIMRLTDPDEMVRVEAIKTIYTIYHKKSSTLDTKSIILLCERAKDKKKTVRFSALKCICDIFYQNINELDDQKLKEFSIIPNTLLSNYFIDNLEEKHYIDYLFHKYIIPFNLSNKSRMQLFYNIFLELQPKSIIGLNGMYQLKHIASDRLYSLLKECSNRNEIEFEKIYSKLDKIIPDSLKTKASISSFYKFISNKKIFNILLKICKTDLNCKNIKNEILFLEEGSSEMNFILNFVFSSSYLNFNKKSIKNLIKVIASKIKEKQTVRIEKQIKELISFILTKNSDYCVDENFNNFILENIKNDQIDLKKTIIKSFKNSKNLLNKSDPQFLIEFSEILYQFLESNDVSMVSQAAQLIVKINNLTHMNEMLIKEYKNAYLNENWNKYLIILSKILKYSNNIENIPMLQSIGLIEKILFTDESFNFNHKISAVKLVISCFYYILKPDVIPEVAESDLHLLVEKVLCEKGNPKVRKYKCDNSSQHGIKQYLIKKIIKTLYLRGNEMRIQIPPTLFFQIFLTLNDTRNRCNCLDDLILSLLSRKLPIEFLATFCLLDMDEIDKSKRKMIQSNFANIHQVRNDIATKYFTENDRISAFPILPEYCVIHSIYLLCRYTLENNEEESYFEKYFISFLNLITANSNSQHLFMLYKLFENLKHIATNTETQSYYRKITILACNTGVNIIANKVTLSTSIANISLPKAYLLALELELSEVHTDQSSINLQESVNRKNKRSCELSTSKASKHISFAKYNDDGSKENTDNTSYC